MGGLLLENISKIFKLPGGREIRAVDGISLEVADGQSAVLLGPSGSGKTVTLRLIAGLEELSGGTITIGGQVINGLAAKDLNVAMVFQGHALYPHMTAAENLAFGLKVRGVPAAERQRRVQHTAGLLGISECLRMRPGELSSGQRQRVALGRALVRQPALFLFDEPFSSLDAPLRTQLRTEFLRLQKELRWTSVYVTHDQTEAMALADKMAVIRAGRLCQVGTPLELYQRPADQFVAGFVGALPMNLLPGHLSCANERLLFQAEGARGGGAGGARGEGPGALNCALGRADPSSVAVLRRVEWEHLKGQPGLAVLLGVRPEHVRPRRPAKAENSTATQNPPSPQPSPPGEGAAQWKGPVEMVQVFGSETYLQVRCGPQLVTARVAGAESFCYHEEVVLEFDPVRTHLFELKTGKAL